MADIVIIDRVEDDAYDGKAFKKVTDKTGKTFNVKYGREGKLKAKWDLLIPGNAIEITWGEYSGKPFVQDFKVVAEVGAVAKLEPQPSDKVLPEHKQVIADVLSEPKEDNLPRTSFPPVGYKKTREQEIAEHVWWKELGNRIGDGSIEKDYPNKAVKIKHEYYKKMSEITGVDFK